ncbi:unnamed protein product [Clonostachys rhizophaga]|uniref:BZIP domain-containing protein n=1 Tax=Clonostachys rhizophaga TaxID=160324 RepID=A0A9N9VAJ6_9HYPO|nr:unnamed protein product [Clonostachys rhizophaga]
MVVPVPTTSSSSTPHQVLGGIYLDTASRSPSSGLSPSSPPLEPAAPSPPTSTSAYTVLLREPLDLHRFYFYPPHNPHDPPGTRLGPLPPLQDLVLSPIESPNMTTVLSPNSLPPPENAPRMSMTSREWVIPPRPKPGRKPATDTPPTKRKAQNRAAQRAFRERRAARVGELEEQLDAQKATYDKDEAALKEKIRTLELELQSFRSRCLLLENMLERERKERIRAETELEAQKRRPSESYSRRESTVGQPNILPPISQRRSLPNHPVDHPESVLPSLEDADHSLSCGNCSPSACACAEEALASVNSALSQGRLAKRAASPSGSLSSEKRHRPNPITSSFSVQQDDSMRHTENDLKDGCGFCKDGTYCVCADTAAMATPAMTPTADTLPPILSQTQTPPPSEPDSTSHLMVMEMTADGAVKLPRRNNTHARLKAAEPLSRGCGANGPGTCAQCQADPKSGLFCRLMSAKFSREQGGSGGCCGGKGAGGGCCKSAPPSQPQQPEKITLPSLPSLGLSCAEAYQTLSSHRHFDKASDDIGSWLPKLRTTPMDDRDRKTHKRKDVEVEAASIMSVLKDFDVRFGA